MVRRSTVDRSPQPDLYGAGYDPGTESQPAGTGKRPRSGYGWRGAGGRWLVWTFRVVVWAVLLIIGYRGVMAIVLNETPPSTTPPAPAASTPAFPVQEASAYALQFGQVYLNFSPATAAERASELSAFLPAGSSSQFGWNGNGSLTVQSVQAAGVQVQSAHSAVVSVLALANGRLIDLSVPVYYSGGALVVSGEPALTSPPAGVAPPAAAKETVDRPAQQELTGQLPAFFRAYASGSSAQLAPFAAPGAKLTGLGGQVSFGGITGVSVPAAAGSVRQITVTVAWLPASTPSAGPGNSSAGGRAQIEMTYAMTVVQRAGRWFVSSIGASTTLTPES